MTSTTPTMRPTATVSPRARYRAGFFDGLLGLPPAWLGIDDYKRGYERAARHVRLAEESPDLQLLGVSPDQTERLYLHVPSGVEVFVHLDDFDFQWRGSVPGYGCVNFCLVSVVSEAVRGGPCWGYKGVGVDGRGKDVRRWFTADNGNRMLSRHRIQMLAA